MVIVRSYFRGLVIVGGCNWDLCNEEKLIKLILKKYDT